MVTYIDPAELAGAQFTLKPIGNDDYQVNVGGRSTGRVMRRLLANRRQAWFWTLTGPYVPQSLHPISGDAASLDEAKAAIKATFDRWLRWAVGRGEVVWRDGYEPPRMLH